MRFSAAVAVIILVASLSGFAQQDKGTLRVKPSHKERSARKTAVPSGKANSSTTKDLQALEHQTAKSSTPRSSTRKASTGVYRPVQEKANAPINVGGGGKNGGGGSRQSGNPYKGRLKQKYGRQH